jgi:hypothetical protein
VGQPDAQQRLLQALAEGLTTTAEIYGFATRDETAAWIMHCCDLQVSANCGSVSSLPQVALQGFPFQNPFVSRRVSVHVREPQQPPTPAAFVEYVAFCCEFKAPKHAGHPAERKQPFPLAKGTLITLPTHAFAALKSENPYVLLKEVHCCFSVSCAHHAFLFLEDEDRWEKEEEEGASPAFGGNRAAAVSGV